MLYLMLSMLFVVIEIAGGVGLFFLYQHYEVGNPWVVGGINAVLASVFLFCYFSVLSYVARDQLGGRTASLPDNVASILGGMLMMACLPAGFMVTALIMQKLILGGLIGMGFFVILFFVIPSLIPKSKNNDNLQRDLGY